MYAVVVKVKIDAGQEGAAKDMLASTVVPMVKGSAGFVSGQWAHNGLDGYSMSVFDTEDHARATAPPLGRMDGSPVEITEVVYAEVVASA